MVKRGDIVTVAISGDYGKPRPAVVIQSDKLQESDSVLVCPLTSTLRDLPLYRLDLPSGETTGLRRRSQIMAEKVTAVRRDRCGRAIGKVDESTLVSLSRMLTLLIGAAD